MKRELFDLLICPACRNERLSLSITEEEGDKIVTGKIVCSRCGRNFVIDRGIPHMICEEHTCENQHWQKKQKDFAVRRNFMWQRMEKLSPFRKNRRKHEETYFDWHAKFFDDFCNLSGRILDIGCGPMIKNCILAGHQFERVMKLDYIGIDPLTEWADDCFPFIQAVGEKLPLKNEIFQGVFIVGVLDHALYPDEIIKESYRVLKSGGRLYVANSIIDLDNRVVESLVQFSKRFVIWFMATFEGKHLHYFQIRDLREVLEANLTITRQQLVWPKHIKRPYVFLEAVKT